MIETETQTVVGNGAPDLSLSVSELRAIVEQALASVETGARMLAVVPDKTRDDNTDLLFPLASQILKEKNVAQFDALVAQGTHPPMTESQKREKIGYGNAEISCVGSIFDHQWDRAEEL